ncbi:replication-relaxation family protein [Alicyclobacillus ferrooxydans]|uniref:Uncharacterized protein n=1 Tax=Alicyclobacillus ferrooxydans TaxID=471514 RepID=A0A0P9D870_9BACL|nr:replication-relaxation family protein [Alicyclobacillus ferrooxydans]KPV45488.1 hypothetical protein AN477_00560 [Alicyclobacillus ferrooxydans]
MILNWADGQYTDTEKIVGAIYDAGCIRRSDLMEILEWKRSKTDAHLLKLRQREMLITRRDHRSETVYMLAENGVRFAQQLVGFDGKVITMEAQISHQLGVNDILMRFIRAYGRDGVKWYSTREASDELFNFRSMVGQSDRDIRTNYIRPDALILTPNDYIFWIEYDNATESSRQIRKKYMLYIQNLSVIDEVTYGEMRRVVWISPSVERTRWLEARWNEVKEKRNTNVEMRFFVAGEETHDLAGIKVQQTV